MKRRYYVDNRDSFLVSPTARVESLAVACSYCIGCPDASTPLPVPVVVGEMGNCHPYQRRCFYLVRLMAQVPGAEHLSLEKQLGGTALFFSGSIGKVSPLGAQVSLLDPVAFTCFTKPLVP